MDKPRKLWRVDITSRATMYVAAPTRARAEIIAERDARDLIGNDLDIYALEASLSAVPGFDFKHEVHTDGDDYFEVGDWVEAGGDPAHGSAIGALEVVASAAWFGSAPRDPRDLPRWCVARPEWLSPTTLCQQPWGFALADGRAGASDGCAMLIVDGAEDPGSPHPYWEPGFADRSVGDLLGAAERDLRSSATVDRETVRAWLTGAHDRVRVGDTTLARPLVLAWVWPAVATAESARVSWGGPLDPVLFQGTGWTALLMGVRASDDEQRGEPLAVAPEGRT